MENATSYEANFSYSKGSLAVTPGSWQNFAWFQLRKELAKDVAKITKADNRILIVGVGDGGVLLQMKWKRVEAIGIDINKKFLRQSKKFCTPIVASASHFPFKDGVVDTVFFELVLHHLKGQMPLELPIKEAYRTLTSKGKVVAIEPNALNPSGFLLNTINQFHLYAKLFGGSNYEFALTPKEIATSLSEFSSTNMEGLSFIHPRFPLTLQNWILKNNSFFKKYFTFFAWILIVIGYKGGQHN
jgi:ubiquinone/menaquinone biosynthesis C-methylase UbiE